ncbi:PAS domain S-box protein [Belliella sp. DSM 111904]|uniref:histidine kinase n=1 Tax=Belliella filtrata TaxID=2923435 RepID=A0ABS9UUL5_9BACT|nr:PAS domain S-box protein [Belliella filtrata]MCH7407861.1 PAS domain S-box protein [Belliella filtrata]
MEKSLDEIDELCNLIKSNDQIMIFLRKVCLQNIWFWEIESPESAWINDNIRSILGYQEPLKKSDWNKIINLQDLEVSNLGFAYHLKNENALFDQTVRFKNNSGHTLWYRCQGKVITEPNGNKLKAIGIFSDITEQKEQELKSKLILQDTNTGVWELDIATGRTIWSETVYAIHEIPRGFDHNMYNGIEFYHQDYRSIISKAVENCINEGISFNLECLLITAKKNLKWVKSTGSKVGNKLIGSFQDITDIKEKELKFKGIFNSTFAFIGFLNTDGILLEANDTAVKMAGVAHEDVIGKHFWDCYWWQISEETKKELQNKFKLALSGQPVEYEVDVWVAGKTPITILFSLKPIFDEYRNVVYVIPEGRPIQDIIEVRNRYKAVIEGTQAGTFEWNIQSGHVIINDKLANLLGYSLKEFQNTSLRKWSTIIHNQDFPIAQEMIIKCFKKELNFFELEIRLKHKSGKWIWLNTRGKISEWNEAGTALKMYGTFIEISKRKKAEEELLYNKNILEALYSLSPIGIALNDFETGKFIDINHKLIEPTGYSKEEFLNLSYWDVTPIEYKEFEEIALDQLNDRGYYELFEKEYIRKDGSRYPVDLQGILITDVNGKKLIWSFIRDITLEKENKNKLQEAVGNLQAVLDITQDQNKRLRNFAHIVSHNLRSHGSGISGLLEIFSDENPNLHNNELLKLVDQAAKNLMETIEDLTEVVQVNLSNKTKSEIYLKRVTQKNLDSLAAHLSLSKCKVINQVPDKLTISGIPAYIDSIILNFITNAIKYRSSERSPIIEIFTTSNDQRVFLHFKDNGLGIDLDKYKDSLFGMYKTFHHHEDSRGVGLFITKNQVESMGGTIAVESIPGEGTTFIVALPKV